MDNERNVFWVESVLSTEPTLKRNNHFLKVPNIFKRFGRDRKGTTAIEFAFVAGPFFLLIFAIIETSLFFFASQYLETSVDNVTRKLRTGQLKNITTAAQFKTEICNEVTVMFDCQGKLKVRVEVAATFNDLGAPPEPVEDDDGEFSFGDDEFTKPSPMEILQVTASYLWPIYTNYSAPLADVGSGRYAAMHASAVVRAEPFSE